MKCPLLLLIITALTAQETPPPPIPIAAIASTNNKSIFVIDPKARCNDYVQAFETLRRDKPTLKITIRTNSGTTYSNVSDLTASQSGSLLFIKTLSTQGTRITIVPVEEIGEITYSS